MQNVRGLIPCSNIFFNGLDKTTNVSVVYCTVELKNKTVQNVMRKKARAVSHFVASKLRGISRGKLEEFRTVKEGDGHTVEG